MSLSANDVLKPLKHRFPKDPEVQADRLRQFAANVMEYKSQHLGSAAVSTNLLMIRNEAQKVIRKAGVTGPKEAIDNALQEAGFYSTAQPQQVAPEEAEASRLARIDELRPTVKRILEHPDPLALAVADIQACGYAGDTSVAEATYVVVTTRLLPIQKGQMPTHTAHSAGSGEGKTYTAESVLNELPECAYVKVQPGSPKAFIYGTEQLRYKVLFFPEIDTLPEGEDQPLSTSIRTLLQNGNCGYDVVEKDAQTNSQTVRKITREGPTTLLTTTTRSLDGKQGSQMDTRLFTMTLPETAEQHAAALEMIAALSNEMAPRQPDPALIAFQEYLQLQAPWHVTIPFAGHLAQALSSAAAPGRIMRDFARLLAFIKGVTIIRQAHRERNSNGAVIATLEDYGTARRLLNQIFVGSNTGAPGDLRLVVEFVKVQIGPVSLADLQQGLKGKVGPPSVYRYVTQALKQGWLDLFEGSGKPATQWKLVAGDHLPEWAGLPTVEELAADLADDLADSDGEPVTSHVEGEPWDGPKGFPQGSPEAEEMLALPLVDGWVSAI